MNYFEFNVNPYQGNRFESDFKRANVLVPFNTVTLIIFMKNKKVIIQNKYGESFDIGNINKKEVKSMLKSYKRWLKKH